MTDFRFLALPEEDFAPLFDKTDAELHALGARRVVARAKPGYPCRVSLKDAEPGETVLLVPFVHHDTATPYRASGPIFVRRAARAQPAVNEVPALFRGRLMSLRAYDADGMMRAADAVEGKDLEAAIRGMFADAQVSYLHAHNAKPGCYAAAVVRA